MQLLRSRLVRMFPFVAFTALAAACGGEDDGPKTETVDPGDGDPASEGSGTLELSFSPMYSGYDGVHEYKLPVIVKGMTGAKFSASDPSKVDVVDTAEGAMLTMKGAGEVMITAAKGGMSGSAKLTIYEYTPAQWETGNDRYNNGNVAWESDATGVDDAGIFTIDENSACTSCHGETAAGMAGVAIEHTPQQTGGYSNAQLANVFLLGKLPEGVEFRFDMIPQDEWSRIHQWKMKKEEQEGIVAYLRSLTPKSQGAVDFPEPRDPEDIAAELPDASPCPTDGVFSCEEVPGQDTYICTDPNAQFPIPPMCTTVEDCATAGLPDAGCVEVFQGTSLCVQPCNPEDAPAEPTETTDGGTETTETTDGGTETTETTDGGTETTETTDAATETTETTDAATETTEAP